VMSPILSLIPPRGTEASVEPSVRVWESPGRRQE
jgi:hypothetical protein